LLRVIGINSKVIQFKGDVADDSIDAGVHGESTEYIGRSLTQRELDTATSLLASEDVPADWFRQHFGSYLLKTFMKTASLVARNSQAAVQLHANAPFDFQRVAFEYGKHLGMAFQASVIC
jgi:geranylgeranyl pyrophosphate synthase